MRSSIRSPIQDKFLISSQPGFQVLVVTCAICFAIGMSIRGFLHTTRITRQVTQAAKQISKNIHIEFAGADLSLADGIFPRLAVLVHRVQVNLPVPCYSDVRIKIDEIELPLSISQIIKGRGPIHQVYANKVDIDLGDRDASCGTLGGGDSPMKVLESLPGAENLPTAERNPSSKPQASVVKVSGDLNANNVVEKAFPSNQVDFVVIEELSLRMTGWRQNLVLNQIQAVVKDHDSKNIEIKSQIGFGGDNPLIDYLNQANLQLNYQKLPDEKLSAHVFGHWREGYYSIIANCRIDDEQCLLESQLNSISVSQALVAAEKLGLIKETIKVKPWWLSARIQSRLHFRRLSETVSDISDLRLEGEGGRIVSDRVVISSENWRPVRPFVIDVDQVKMDSLVPQSRIRDVSKYFESLGKLTGRITVTNFQDYRFIGNISDMGINFSNKGDRAVQQFQNLSTEIVVKSPRINATVTAIEPKQGQWRGSVKLASNIDVTEGHLEVQADELQFSPAVTELFTRGGKIGTVNLQFAGNWKDRDWYQANGELHVDELNVEGHWLKNLLVKLKGEADWNFNLSVQRWSIDPKFLATLFTRSGVDPEPMGDLEMLKGRARFQSPSTVNWTHMTAKNSKGDFWSSTGGWSNAGTLGGTLVLKTKSRDKNRIFQLSGIRDEPRLILQNNE